MLLYEKMREYIHTKLGCKIFDLFELNGELKYVRFQTQKGTFCLAKITRPMTYPSGHNKLVQLIPYEDNQKDKFDYFITDDFSLVKKISPSLSPTGYIHFLNRLNPSLVSTVYSVAVITPEYLIVDDHIYHVKLNVHDSQILITMDLGTVIERNITAEVQRVYDNISDILNETTDKFKIKLKTILTKCSEMKILSDKTPKLDLLNLMDKDILLSETHQALTIATEALGKIDLLL